MKTQPVVRILLLDALFLCLVGVLQAQQPLSLDSCRALALVQNRDLQMGDFRIEKAKNEHEAAFTNFLPKLSARGAYFYNGKNVSLLSDEQKSRLENMGHNAAERVKENSTLQKAMLGLMLARPDLAPLLKQMLEDGTKALASGLNGLGSSLVDNLSFDMHNTYLGAVTLTQPIFMGGKIMAYNKATRLAADLAIQQEETTRRDVIVSTDKAYWQVVSLVNKQELTKNYLALLQKLEGDIEKMVKEGVATKSDLLSVRVKVNDAEMSVAKVEDGLNLSRKLLCQLCGLPLDSEIELLDEGLEDFHPKSYQGSTSVEEAYKNRSELRSLELGVQIYKEKVKIARSAYMPQVALVGNFLVSNPSLYNGFEKKFNWNWNIGVTLSVPIWNWRETTYKVRSARAEYREQEQRLLDVREKMELQVSQAVANVRESNKRLAMTERNLERAEENLRYANVGFAEGVITVAQVLEAQTAWLSARSTRLDAKIDVQLADVNLRRVLGVEF
ncbi:MAG: TolC family protein [Bacteroides sp.]